MNQDSNSLRILIHSARHSKPNFGDPWIIVNLWHSVDNSWAVMAEVRCDRSLEDIRPDVITAADSIADALEAQTKLKLNKKEITIALGQINLVQANILIRTAEKAKEAGVAELLR